MLYNNQISGAIRLTALYITAFFLIIPAWLLSSAGTIDVVVSIWPGATLGGVRGGLIQMQLQGDCTVNKSLVVGHMLACAVPCILFCLALPWGINVPAFVSAIVVIPVAINLVSIFVLLYRLARKPSIKEVAT